MEPTRLLPLFVLLFARESSTQPHSIPDLFEDLNARLTKYNALAADIAWQSTVDPGNPNLPDRAARYEKSRIEWQHHTCDLLRQLGGEFNKTQRRQTYLLCRGPKYLPSEARQISSLYDTLQAIYSESKVCIPTANNSRPISSEAAILNFLTAVKVSRNGETGIGDAAKLAEGHFENGMCFQGENDFGKLMRSRNEDVLKWAWLAWREIVGPSMRQPYTELVQIENMASMRNGYHDIGQAWRDELETSNLRGCARRLHAEVKPLYVALHGVVRFFLRRFHGETVPERGLIPAHLLGDLWSQNWGQIIDLILPTAEDYDLDRSIRNSNWTVLDMVRKAEDFYTSLSLPPMTEQFWRNSVFERGDGGARCHGTAANMFHGEDFRMLYCAEVSMEDFYVLHHEMGHIQYYMAYQNQPGVFQEGANSALHETIGDAVMYGVMSPQHLHRLGLINDTVLFNKPETKYEKEPHKRTNYVDDTSINEISKIGNEGVDNFLKYVRNKEYDSKKYKETRKHTHSEPSKLTKHKSSTFGLKNAPSPFQKIMDVSFDEILLLKQALVKIPQIPFSLLVDEFRWDLFEGDFYERSYNEVFWELVQELQGVAPPEGKRGEEYFDAGAKFHVPDNTPYIRYFLSSFLQAQVFRSLCRATVLGVRHTGSELPPGLALHRCDIYGSKQPGRLLKRMMSQGSSIRWREALHILTDEDQISSEALLQYYKPLYPLLARLIDLYDIPLGW